MWGKIFRDSTVGTEPLFLVKTRRALRSSGAPVLRGGACTRGGGQPRLLAARWRPPLLAHSAPFLAPRGGSWVLRGSEAVWRRAFLWALLLLPATSPLPANAVCGEGGARRCGCWMTALVSQKAMMGVPVLLPPEVGALAPNPWCAASLPLVGGAVW